MYVIAMDKPQNQEITKRIYGKNYLRALSTFASASINAKSDFISKYPYADRSRFSFQTFLNSDGTLDRVDINFISGKSLFDITSDTFKNNGEWTKYLTINSWPQIWKANGTVQAISTDVVTTVSTYPKVKLVNPESFNIYVNKTQFFASNLPMINVSLPTSPNFGDDEPYIIAIRAAYLASHLCGISVEHLTPSPNVHPIITSLMRFHIYIWIRRVLRNPKLLDDYKNRGGDPFKAIDGHIPMKAKWVRVYDTSHSRWNLALYERDILRKNGVRYRRGTLRYERGAGGIYAISYEIYEKSKKVKDRYLVGAAEDFCRFIPDRSDGITIVGEELLNISIEVFTFAILGSQAWKRNSIVGYSSLRLEVQKKFRQIVGDFITGAETDWLAEMRKSIGDTKVTLNLAVSPTLLLLPSDMIILKTKIPGYNNVLSVASSGVVFGVNSKLNYDSTLKKEAPKKLQDHDTPINHLPTLGEDNVTQPKKPSTPLTSPTSSPLVGKPITSDNETAISVAIVLAIASFMILKYVV